MKSHNYQIAFICLSILTGIYPVISLWNNNIGEIQTTYVLGLTAVTIVINLAIYGLWLSFIKSPIRSALLSIVTYLFLYSFGHIYNIIGNPTIFGIRIGFFKLFAIWTIFFILLCFLINKIKQMDFSVVLGLNISALVLVLLNLFPILSYEIQLDRPQKGSQTSHDSKQPVNENRPDIYYIVLDSYTRNDVLTDLMNYDNSDFLKELEARGFYIPECALSNYNGTSKTISSVLNYDYLVQGQVISDDDSENPSAQDANLIKDNKVRTYFSNQGYKLVTGRAYSPRLNIDNSDIFLNYSLNKTGIDDLDRKQFLNLYLNTTVFRVLTELYMNNSEALIKIPYWLINSDLKNSYLYKARLWYDQNSYMFDSIATIPVKPGNYLVYAHIIAPHGPYVYRQDGSFRYPLDTKDEKVLYVDLLKYINKRVLEVVDTLLSNSSIPPIIIIQGDHGIHKLTHGLDKHKILSAYYFPGNLITPPYPTLTPVNNFRMIINNYFDPSMPLIPDTIFLTGKKNNIVAASCDLK